MFSKGNEHGGNGSTDSSRVGNGGGVPSILGSDLKITGDLISGGDIQIDGVVVGDIKTRALTIGANAKVEGTIAAKEVRLGGSFDGKLEADEVSILKGAKMKGDIAHRNLSIDPGASFEGQVQQIAGSPSAQLVGANPGSSGKDASFEEDAPAASP